VLRGARVVADADGVVVARSASLHEDKLELAHVDGRTGKETWSASSALPSSSKVALTGDHVVALRVELSGKKVPLTMEGFDRRTGARCWSMRDEFALVVQTEIAAARDVVYVSSVPGHFVAGRLTTVLAIEAATGTILWSRDVDLDTAALVRAWNVQLHPCRGALLIGAGANGVHIARLGAAP
jgi:outer membrane protein assembly factor BamB